MDQLKNVSRIIKERLANVMSYFRYEITNAVVEGISSKIMSIKRRVGVAAIVRISKRQSISTVADSISINNSPG
ncbi:transposase [Crateriforma spongiae]|uniref:transposase n=1 Tax=Crateriforma spongiae TaxID=2724528 RepID=UPI0036F384A0